MNSDFEWILEDCLKRLRSGQSPEDCLAAYPEQAEGLRPLLHTAAHLQAVPAPQPRPQALRSGRERMLAAAQSNLAEISFVQPVSSGEFSRYTVRIFTFLKTLLFGKETHGMKLALRLAVDLVVILMIGSVLTVNASAHSLPSDPLYAVKRTWEEMRLTLTLNDSARQQLQDQFQQLRLEEVREMVRLGKTGMVDFEGQLESIAANEWRASGIRVRMLPDTIVEGAPEVGQMVRVRARVQNDGTLHALQIRVQVQGRHSSPYPPPMSTNEPTPTFVPSHTPWPTHEPTHTPEPTHGPTHQPGPKDEHHDGMPGPTPQPDDGHHNGMPGATSQPNDGCCNDDHHNGDGHHSRP